MKKLALGLVVVIAVLILGVLGMASTQPDQIHLDRSITVAAAAVDMAPFASDLRRVNTWSPWVGIDPDAQTQYSENSAGVGAWYSWSGNNEVGEGKMSITVAEPSRVVHHLEFLRPFESQADATMSWAAEGDDLTITWAFDQAADFPMKVMGVFMSMEDMLGPEYEKGLAMLEPLIEEAATTRLAAEKAAAEVAAAAAQAAVEGAEPAAEGAEAGATPPSGDASGG